MVDEGRASLLLVKLEGDRSGTSEQCEAVWSRTKAGAEIAVFRSSGQVVEVCSDRDFEDALHRLRCILEADGLVLACNRFRRDAFASSMSRQLSDGLRCYLVSYGRLADPHRIFDSFGSTDPLKVASVSANRAFVRRWIWSCQFTAPFIMFRELLRRTG